MTDDQLNRLDSIVLHLIDRRYHSGFNELLPVEKLYVSLAANRHDLLAILGRTIAGALNDVGPDNALAMSRRWANVAPWQ